MLFFAVSRRRVEEVAVGGVEDRRRLLGLVLSEVVADLVFDVGPHPRGHGVLAERHPQEHAAEDGDGGERHDRDRLPDRLHGGSSSSRGMNGGGTGRFSDTDFRTFRKEFGTSGIY